MTFYCPSLLLKTNITLALEFKVKWKNHIECKTILKVREHSVAAHEKETDLNLQKNHRMTLFYQRQSGLHKNREKKFTCGISNVCTNKTSLNSRPKGYNPMFINY